MTAPARQTELKLVLFPVETRPLFFREDAETKPLLFDVEVTDELAAADRPSPSYHQVPRFQAIVDVERNRTFSVVSDQYRLVSNREALVLGEQCFRQVFSTTTADRMEVFHITVPSTRSFCHVDFIHKDHTFEPFKGDKWWPYLRVTNSYNRTKPLRFDLGFCRAICTNGVIFGSEHIVFRFYHTHDQIGVEGQFHVDASLAQVLEERIGLSIRQGIRHDQVARLESEIEQSGLDKAQRATAEDELESTRQRREDLKKELEVLRTRISTSQESIGLDKDQLRDALSCSLEIMRAKPLEPSSTPSGQPARFAFPNLNVLHGGDPNWTATLDTLRALPADGEKNFQWRRESPIRPVVFDPPEGIDDDVVQLHLEHRMVQRLLSRFTAQGFVHLDLSRACLAQSADAIQKAKQRAMIPYSELVGLVNSVNFNAYDQRLFAMLGQVSIEEDENGRPLLSVLGRGRQKSLLLGVGGAP